MSRVVAGIVAVALLVGVVLFGWLILVSGGEVGLSRLAVMVGLLTEMAILTAAVFAAVYAGSGKEAKPFLLSLPISSALVVAWWFMASA